MRNSFLYPIPEISIAADLLKLAADSLLSNDIDKAGKYIVEADMPIIGDYYEAITGKINPVIHWQVSISTDLVPATKRDKTRRPNAKEELEIFERDGWKCRYCGCRVISKKAKDVFTKIFPKEAYWGRKWSEKHNALKTLMVSLDHILPHSRGGNNNPLNLVTSCVPCQFGRNNWTLEEVGFNDPTKRDPVIDKWDGLHILHSYKQ